MITLKSQTRQAPGAGAGILVIFLLACAPPLSLSAQQPGTAIVFYAQPQVREDLWPALFEALRADLDAGIGKLPNGLSPDRTAVFLRGEDFARSSGFANVVEVELLGRCDLLPQADRPFLRGPLGWVVLASGKIRPIVSIDCARLAQVLRPAAIGLDKEARRHAMAQAIAHVLIHEWIHVATQSPSHAANGILQATLTINQLIAEPRSRRSSLAAR